MNYIFASDPHGTGQPWIDKVEMMKSKYPDAQVVFGGDYIDGRAYSKETLEYVKSQVEDNNAVALRGNHENLMLNALFYGEFGLWKMNGAKSTIKSLLGRGYSDNKTSLEIKKKHSKLIEWMKNLPVMYETENILFVHAGFDMSLEDPVEDTSDEDKTWVRDEYMYGMQDYFAHNCTEKAIVTGHTPTVFVHGRYENDEYDPIEKREFYSDDDYECPIVTVQYPGEPPRHFTDGGCHGDLDYNTGNVVCLDSNGDLIDVIS